MTLKYYTIFALLCVLQSTFAQNKNWSLHFQQTVIPQHKLKIKSPYSGTNSLSDTAETQTSLTTTVFLGRRLWKGASIFYNPEMAGGSGLSQARGIAGFTNGECFRIGNPAPALYTARLFYKQSFTLSKKSEIEVVPNGPNSIKGYQSTDRLTFTLGKFALSDIFDNNSYSHDPRSQLMNWALMSAGAWDYPANTRGYTWSAVAEIIHPKWALRLGTSLVPTVANGPVLNWKWGQNHSNTIEFQKNYTILGKEGVLRTLAFYTKTYMGSYAKAVKFSPPDLIMTHETGRTKYGFDLNFEQKLAKNTGIFMRTSWNDGHNETWAFTEIDHSFTLGYVKENPFGRKSDRLNVAMAINGISKIHRNYLAAGGFGFIIGDGKLPNYGTENILEINYNTKINDWLSITPDYQYVINPAYNKDRGTVNVFAIRLHIEM